MCMGISSGLMETESAKFLPGPITMSKVLKLIEENIFENFEVVVFCSKFPQGNPIESLEELRKIMHVASIMPLLMFTTILW